MPLNTTYETPVTKHLVLVFLMLILLLAMTPAGAVPEDEQDLQQAGMAGIAIWPQWADPEITTFEYPNYLYVNRQIVVSNTPTLPPDRHQLLVFLTGTNGHGHSAVEFMQVAANLGYHGIFMVYPDDIPASICDRDQDPTAFEQFRMTIIAGGSSEHISVARPECIENRLIKTLLYAQKLRPKENWAQFLNEDGSIKWESIAVAGQSQGGGHAALIAIKHRVARAICTGAPRDFSSALNEPAAWYSLESATPKACFFSYTGLQDSQASTPEQLMENLRALGLDQFGPPVDVDDAQPPYNHTRILVTNWPGGTLDSLTAHLSVITAKNPSNQSVWTYMLTEPTP